MQPVDRRWSPSGSWLQGRRPRRAALAHRLTVRPGHALLRLAAARRPCAGTTVAPGRALRRSARAVRRPRSLAGHRAGAEPQAPRLRRGLGHVHATSSVSDASRRRIAYCWPVRTDLVEFAAAQCRMRRAQRDQLAEVVRACRGPRRDSSCQGNGQRASRSRCGRS